VNELLGMNARGVAGQVTAVLERQTYTKIMPWEDAITGLLLSRHISGAGLFYVDVSRAIFAEAWGAYIPTRHLRASVLFYHENFKWPGRLWVAHEWAQYHRCAKLTPSTLKLVCEHAAPSCTNTAWTRCGVRTDSYHMHDHSPAGCSLEHMTNWIEEGCQRLRGVADRTDPPLLPSVCGDTWRRLANTSTML